VRREVFASDLENLEFLINRAVIRINTDQEVESEVFEKFDILANEYITSYQKLKGPDIRAFVGSYERILRIAKRLAYLEKIPEEQLTKLVNYEGSICKVFNDDADRLKDSITKEIREINDLSS
jgi:hypothetical protein